MSDAKKVYEPNEKYSSHYSEQYKTIRTEAESKWPEWKVTTYNTSIAVSSHARKLSRT